jgi:hypothetical protein
VIYQTIGAAFSKAGFKRTQVILLLIKRKLPTPATLAQLELAGIPLDQSSTSNTDAKISGLPSA